MTSSIPACLTGLVSTWTSAMPDWQVGDGPIFDPRSKYLAVGWLPNDEPAVVVVASPGDTALSSDLEYYEVGNVLSARGKTAVDARAGLFDGFAALKSALAADPHLGGAVMLARVASYALQQERTDETAPVLFLRVTVSVQAEIAN